MIRAMLLSVLLTVVTVMPATAQVGANGYVRPDGIYVPNRQQTFPTVYPYTYQPARQLPPPASTHPRYLQGYNRYYRGQQTYRGEQPQVLVPRSVWWAW